MTPDQPMMRAVKRGAVQPSSSRAAYLRCALFAAVMLLLGVLAETTGPKWLWWCGIACIGPVIGSFNQARALP
jgi:hypothetical protein